MKPYEIIIFQLRNMRNFLTDEEEEYERNVRVYMTYVMFIDGFIEGVTRFGFQKEVKITPNMIDLYHAYIKAIREKYLKG